jgi:hypothetical protein
VSLGGVFTLVYPQPKRDGLIRVSVGCEDIEDLLADFEPGLSFVASGRSAPPVILGRPGRWADTHVTAPDPVR